MQTVIVGGSIAGLSTALHINKGETLLLEKKENIGDNIRCAEGIGNHILKNLGIQPQQEWIANTCKKIQITFPNNKTKTIQLKHIKAHILHRDKFEQHLAKQCINNGVEIRTSSRFLKLNNNTIVYENKGKKYEVEAETIVDATGINASVGKSAGMNLQIPKKDICVCAQKTIQNNNIDDDMIELYVGEQFAPGGYAWVFPKRSNIVNVGLGLTQKQQHLNYYMKKFMNCRFLIGNIKTIKSFKSCVPLTNPPEHIVKNNVLLVGDAARFVNAATGAGIGYAYMSGKIAGEIITQYNIGWNESLQNYEEVMKQILYPKLIRAYKIKNRLTTNKKSMNNMYYRFLPIIYLHKLLPSIERYAMKNFRF